MEQEILDIAIENLSTIPDLMFERTHLDEKSNNTYDGELKLHYKSSSFDVPFVIKRKVTSAQLPFFEEYLPKKGVIIFEAASQAVKEQLRKLRINYIEMSGNAYLSHDNIYIFIDTNKRVKLEDTDSNTAFSKTGLKVIYQLLNNRKSINFTYRELGEIADVSIDTVGRVYKELVRDKYLVKIDNRKYKIIEYDRLFKDWVTLFNKTLRPRLKKRSFRSEHKQSIRFLLEINFNGKIGGELAAERLSKFNIAEKANIYVKGSFVDLAKELDLRPDKDGQITMIEQFWNDQPDSSDRLVGFPLVYADLISDLSPRNLQTAKSIYNEYAYQSL